MREVVSPLTAAVDVSIDMASSNWEKSCLKHHVPLEPGYLTHALDLGHGHELPMPQ